MSDLGSVDDTPAAEPPSKRRKVRGDADGIDDNDGADPTRHDASPTYRSLKPLQERAISIRRGRPPSRSRSRDGGTSSADEDVTKENKTKKGYYSSDGSLRGSRSRSRSRSHSLRSRSRTRSHSRSRSRSRTRSRSQSRSRSGSRSRSRTDSSRTRSRDSSRRSRDDDVDAAVTPLAHSPLPSTGAGAASSASTKKTALPPIQPNYRPRLQLRGHAAAVSQVRVSPDGKWIASASADGTARIWSAASGAHMDTLVGHMAGVNCLAWSPDSATLATGSDDKSIRLWDRATAAPAHEAAGRRSSGGVAPGGAAYAAAAARRRRALAAAAAAAAAAGGTDGATTAAGAAAASDADERRAPIRGSKRALLGHSNYVTCLAFSPKGNLLASGSYDEAVFLWDVRAGVELGREPKDNSRLPAHSDPVSAVDFCSDGTLVVSCSTDGLTRIWDPLTRQCLRTLVHEDNPAVAHACFSPNGRYVLAWSLDSCVRLWDYVAGSVKKTYQGHANARFSIGGCFGVLSRRGSTRTKQQQEADGAEAEALEEKQHGDGDGDDGDDDDADQYPFVASASENGDVMLWDVRSKAVVQRLARAHDGVCFWVDVHGDTLVTGGQDGRIKVFRHVRTPGGAAAGGSSGAAAATAQNLKAEGLGGKLDDRALRENGGEAGAEGALNGRGGSQGKDGMAVDGGAAAAVEAGGGDDDHDDDHVMVEAQIKQEELQ